MGRKKAEQMVLDLADKLDELASAGDGTARPDVATADDAIRALVSLGYAAPDADRAVRKALESAPTPPTAPDLIRAALALVRRK